MNKDLNIIKRLFKILKTPKKSFDQRLIFYQETFNQYKDWRLKYKFPKTKYLSNLSRIKYKPSDKLIRNLSKSISELREEYINLKNYKSIILFKLFLFYFAEVFKIRHKYKLNKSYSGPFSYYFTQGKTPTRRDLDDIMNMVTSHLILNIFLIRKKKLNQGMYEKLGIGQQWIGLRKILNGYNWKKHKKVYGYQKKFATKDHNKENISLPEIQKLDENYQRLISINKQKDSIHIAHLFYELSYCKDFDRIENLFNNKNEKSIEKNNDWLPRDNEKGKDGNATTHDGSI